MSAERAQVVSGPTDPAVRRRRLLRTSRSWGIVGRLILLLVGGGTVLLVVARPYGWFEHPWRARVISVEGSKVCTTPDRSERNPGWADPLCFPYGIPSRDEKVVSVAVGQCVELESFHPLIVFNRVVSCR